MTEEIIALLPSADLKEKIRETNHQFTEGELLQIIEIYAPTLADKLQLLERFAGIASPDAAALANLYAESERKDFARFQEAPAGFVYELRIKENPESYEECYLCASYRDALICIDRYYEEYADIAAKETGQTRYRITKRKILSECDVFEEDAYAECVLGANKAVLEVSDCKHSVSSHDCEQLCSECNQICINRCDELCFPCFARNQDIIRYREHDGKEHFGVCLCNGECGDGLVESFYVIPLDAPAIREHRFDDLFEAHEHIEPPIATIAKPDDLDELMRKNYEAFIAYRNASEHT